MASSGTIKHLWALDAPMLKVDKSIMILGAGGELVSLPSPSFLIEHAEHGLLLFDTGLAGAGDPASTYGPLAELFMIEFPAERALPFGRKTSTRPIGSTGAKCLPDTTTTCSGTAASSCSRCPDTRRVRSG